MSEEIEVHEWRPNYKRRCEVCGERPVVTGVQHAKDGKPEQVVYRGTMCGACTWGSGKLRDPSHWNG
jgi:hypothetical protein